MCAAARHDFKSLAQLAPHFFTLHYFLLLSCFSRLLMIYHFINTSPVTISTSATAARRNQPQSANDTRSPAPIPKSSSPTRSGLTHIASPPLPAYAARRGPVQFFPLLVGNQTDFPEGIGYATHINMYRRHLSCPQLKIWKSPLS